MSEQELDYHRLFDAAPTPYLVLAPDLTIVAVNAAYLAATKSRREALVGKPVFTVFPDNPTDGDADGVANLRRSLETALATGRPDTMALQRYDIPAGADGRFEERYWSPINTPILASDGTITHIIHRVVDVTEFVRASGRPAEGTLARLSELEADLFARAREVQDVNRQLREANQELAETGAALREQQRAKDRFIAMLSHELRNPLAAIRAAVELLCLDVAHDHPSMAVLERQTTALVRMTDDLLDATRALTGQLELVRQRLDLREIVDDAAADAHADAEFAEGRRALRVSVPPEAVQVDGDRVRLAQLLGNLVSNAGKYTQPGATVSVSLTTAGAEAVLTVADDGIGFAPALADSLFGVFTRAVPAGTTTVAGLGLGLAIVRTVAELHGGSASAHSDGPGTGATFRVRLPLAPEPTVDHPQGRVVARRDTLRFLVIDDNADLGTTYRILLERRGDTATVVTTGRAGLAVAAAVPFDVVLCDIGLPDVGGLQVARQLRAQPETKELTLVAVSGFIQERDRQQALDAGFDAYLAKPMALADLDAVLAKLGAPARRP